MVHRLTQGAETAVEDVEVAVEGVEGVEGVEMHMENSRLGG